MSAVDRVVRFWDRLTQLWLAGEDPLPEPLPAWHASYVGHGAGAVTREAFAEPYVGDFRGEPRFVTLGLNPGAASLEFQGRGGLFAEAIRRRGSYSAWAATAPYFAEEWSRIHGRNRYAWSRLRFARDWLEDPHLDPSQLLTFELYPWHSTKVTAPIVPPPEIIDEFIWQPLAELPIEFVFAFGKPWLQTCEALRLRSYARWGPGGADLGSTVESRVVVAYALPSEQTVVVSWQSGYAGPPARPDTLRLREQITDTARRGA